MSKHDLLWLAVKLAGLYLLVEGLLELPLLIAEGGLENQLHAGVPLLAGAIILGVKFRTVAPTLDPQFGPPKFAGTREDLFWLVCKTLGLWFAVKAAVAMPSLILLADGWADWKQAVMMCAAPVQLGLALWLVLSNALPNAVARARIGTVRLPD
ncbi:MAG: hypothetical protein IM674_05235 [Brevundimonas sp.]|jgi:hypothetical protein|nr:hypothetical protein [Brevundimonas sp.]